MSILFRWYRIMCKQEGAKLHEFQLELAIPLLVPPPRQLHVAESNSKGDLLIPVWGGDVITGLAVASRRHAMHP